MVNPIPNSHSPQQSTPFYSAPSVSRGVRDGLASVPTRMTCFVPPGLVFSRILFLLRRIDLVRLCLLLLRFVIPIAFFIKGFIDFFRRQSNPSEGSGVNGGSLPSSQALDSSPSEQEIALEKEVEIDSREFILFPKEGIGKEEERRGERIKAIDKLLPATEEIETLKEEFQCPSMGDGAVMSLPVIHLAEHRNAAHRIKAILPVSGSRPDPSTVWGAIHHQDASLFEKWKAQREAAWEEYTCPICRAPIKDLALNVTLQKEIERALIDALLSTSNQEMEEHLRKLLNDEEGQLLVGEAFNQKVEELRNAITHVPDFEGETPLQGWVSERFKEVRSSLEGAGL